MMICFAAAVAFCHPSQLPPLRAAPRAGTIRARFDDLSVNDDPYALLDAPHDATPAKLRAAFRKKARLCHPDVSPEADAPQRFRKLVAAYEVLSDDRAKSKWMNRVAYERARAGERARAARPTRRRSSRGSRADVRWQTRTQEPPRPWMYDLADAKWVRLALTFGFVGGQWLSWWAFLVGMSNVPVADTVQAVCGFGPC